MGGQQSATENNTEKNKNELSKKEEENEYFILYVELEGKIWQVRFRPKRGEIKMQFIEFLEHQKVVKENEVYYVVQNKYAPLIPLWMSLRIPEHSLVYLFPLKLQKNSFPSPLQFPSPYRAKWCEISHFSNEMLENHLQKASNLKLSKILKKMRKSMEKRAFFEVEITNSDQKKIIDEAFTALEFFSKVPTKTSAKLFLYVIMQKINQENGLDMQNLLLIKKKEKEVRDRGSNIVKQIPIFFGPISPSFFLLPSQLPFLIFLLIMIMMIMMIIMITLMMVIIMIILLVIMLVITMAMMMTVMVTAMMIVMMFLMI